MAEAEVHVMTPEEQEQLLPQPKRKDWQINQQKISSALLTYFRDNLKQPTYPELARLTGLHEQTIIKHMKEMDFAALFQDQKERFATLAPNVMMAIYNSALKGSAKSQEMMMQIIFGWASPKFYDPPEGADGFDPEELKNIDRGIELLLAMKTGTAEKDEGGEPTPRS